MNSTRLFAADTAGADWFPMTVATLMNSICLFAADTAGADLVPHDCGYQLPHPEADSVSVSDRHPWRHHVAPLPGVYTRRIAGKYLLVNDFVVLIVHA